MEFGWALLTKISTMISDSYYFFQISFSVVYCWLSGCFIKKMIPNVFVGTIVFIGIGLFTGAFNVQRQLLAVLIVVHSYIFILEGKKAKSIVGLIVAALIHSSAIIFVIAYILYHYRHNKFFLRISPIIIIIVAINYKKLIEIGRIIFPEYANYYSNYKGNQTASGVWLIWIIIFVIGVYSLYSKKVKDNNYKIVCIFSMVYVVCNIVGLYFNYFERVGWYFMPFIPVMFYYFGKYLTNKMQLLYYIGLVSCFNIYYLIGCFGGKSMEYSIFF